MYRAVNGEVRFTCSLCPSIRLQGFEFGVVIVNSLYKI